MCIRKLEIASVILTIGSGIKILEINCACSQDMIKVIRLLIKGDRGKILEVNCRQQVER